LEGKIRIAGMKNAATPILAACLLADKPCVIKNIPDIADVRIMIEILKSLGLGVSFENHTVTTLPGKINLKKVDEHLIKKLRSSILLLGPLIAKLGNVVLPEPGGCIIGKRPIDTHLYALEALGASIKHQNGKIILKARELVGKTIILPEFSVTATENLLMAASLARGKTIIKMAAIEPHIEDLIKFLNTLGAKIKMSAGHTIIVDGVKKLGGGEHAVIPDSIEAGTLAVAALVTKGKITLEGVNHEHMEAVYSLLQRMGAKIEKNKSSVTIFGENRLNEFKLQALPYPGFPTDLQAPFGLLATQCHGTSLIHDPMYEGRLSYINELIKMGAVATVCDPHRVLVSGPTKLYGTEIKGLDLRAGATLVLAGLIAKGKTMVDGAENLDRGYERFDERLRSLGADIERVE